MTNEELLARAVPALLAWYPAHKKDLPWRVEGNPYTVWISEVMLQQTRTTAAIPYYLRFIGELPDVAALAAVPEDRLMKLWEGLGYYSRARHLRQAAVTVMTDFGGRMPSTAALLRTLPGVGDYTAGAIASIAFGEPEPAVDGNVLRVVMRLLASDEDVLRDTTKKRVAALLRAVYPSGKDAGTLTQAWMELGENVCIPNGTPACDACPLVAFCRARLGQTVALYPVRSPKKPRRIEERTVLLLRAGDAVALTRRPPHGLLAGLYEFPNYEGTPDDLPAWCSAHGVTPVSVTPIGNATHRFSHIEWRMQGVEVALTASAGDFLWVPLPELFASFAIPSAFRYFTEYLRKEI